MTIPHVSHAPYAPLVIGINGGGTHTSFALVDAALNVLARAESGPSNVNYVGLAAVRDALDAGLRTLFATIPRAQIAAIGAGMAGIDRPADQERMRQVFAELCPGTPVTLDNDAVPALVAGVGARFGIVTICGTGMIALGMNGQGERARSGGWGNYPDHGSGYAMGRDVLRAIFRAYDGSGPQTALTGRVLARLGLNTPPDLVNWLYDTPRRVDEIAAFAAEAVQAAAEHDNAAIRVVVQAARSLAAETINVGRKLQLTDPAVAHVPVLMSGGLFTYSALLREVFTSTVQTSIPAAMTLTTDRDAALGAGMMALDLLGIALPHPDYTLTTERQRRATERRNPLTMRIHQRPTLDLVTMMNLEDEWVPQVIQEQLPQIAALINAAAERFAQGGRVIMLGAGTSGRLAVLDAAECRPTFSTTLDQVVGILAGGEQAMIHSVEGAEDDHEAGRAVIAERYVDDQDTVIGVAASGSTPFVRGALEEASARGALTASIVNVVDAPLSAIAQHPIVLATGPEALTGSTRLKAGTAQKLALNMISTGIMVRVGKTFGNLMTDMQASNIKLRNRAIVIVGDATGLSQAEAEALLTACDGEMKTAIAAALLNLPPAAARERLNAARGNLTALES
jgi:N-acetylmuramic acid 6-phosphate etherase